jgi:hypothetical protein
VVASDIPGYRSVITGPEVGLLTPPRNAERLAWSICHLLRDDDLRARVGQAGQMRAREFSWTRITEAVEQVYQEGRLRALHRPHRRHIWSLSGAPLLPPLDSSTLQSAHGATSVWAISPFDENVVE